MDSALRRALPGSVLWYLVLIALVPLTVAGAFGVLLVGQARDRAASAESVETAMLDVQHLGQARTAVMREMFSATVDVSVRSLGLTTAVVKACAGGDLGPGLDDAGADTDRWFAALEDRDDPRTSAARRALREARAVADRPVADPTFREILRACRRVGAAYTVVGEALADEQSRLAASAVTGAPGSPLRTATQNVTAVAQLVTAAGRRAVAVYLTFGTWGSAHEQALRALTAADDVYASTVRDEVPRLSRGGRREWDEFAGSTASRAFDALARKVRAQTVVDPPADVNPLSLLGAGGRVAAQGAGALSTLRQGVAVAAWTRSQDQLLTAGVSLGVARTTAEREGAADRATVVLFVDLDRFKQVNDACGHAAGDHVLRVVAGRMAACLPSDAVLARIGGDEFLVILPGGADPDVVVALAETLVVAVGAPIDWQGTPVAVGASVGIAAAAPQDGAGDAVDAVLARADAAVYRAKREGRGPVRSEPA